MAFVNVDFTKEHRDLVRQGLDQILSQYKNSCVLLRFFEAFLEEVQVLFDAIHAARAGRQLATATDYNLDALGRIVGALRTGISYEMLTWLYTETPHRITDETPVWVKNGALIGKPPVRPKAKAFSIFPAVSVPFMKNLPNGKKIQC